MKGIAVCFDAGVVMTQAAWAETSQSNNPSGSTGNKLDNAVGLARDIAKGTSSQANGQVTPLFGNGNNRAGASLGAKRNMHK